ncbi:hypothetical protein Hanom_Chr02g00119751 [Helianthus anomalus]
MAEEEIIPVEEGQTVADAPPGYITLFADFFIDSNFRLPATQFMVAILHFYGFHISQLSPMGMLIWNKGFYSFGLIGAKKLLINPPKIFHDWKMKFFYIREEVIPIAMIFWESDKIEKEELPIPKAADWYMRLMATPNRVFGEQVLVAEVAQLYQSVFPTFGGAMGVRPLTGGYEQIKNNFLYPPAGIFASPLTATEGTHLPKPRTLRGVTSTRKEILYLSSEESVGSSNEELSSWSNIFAGVLCDLGIDPKEKPNKAPTKKKAETKKKVTTDAGATSKKAGGSRATAEIPQKGTLRFRQSNLEDYVVASDSLEGLSRIGERSKRSAAATSKSSGSARSRAPESGATPSSLREEEEVEEEGAKLALKKPKVNPKRPEAKKTKFTIIPSKTIPEKEVEKRVEEPTTNVIPEKDVLRETEIAVTTVHDKAQGLKVVRITGLDQPLKTKDQKFLLQVWSNKIPLPLRLVRMLAALAPGQKGDPKRIPRPRSPIAHAPVWSLKQKETFVEFGVCQDWFLGTFPWGEVNHQRARNHEILYHAYIISEANISFVGHQILREWWTMHRECASWEKYRERLSAEAKEFEQSNSQLQEEKVAFNKEKKSEEWGCDGLKSKLQASEELLAKERQKWKKVCENDNKRMYVARTKITNFEAEVPTSKGKIEEAKSDRECAEVNLNAQIVSKKQGFSSMDVEIAELKRRIFEAHEKNEFLKIDLAAEKVKADIAEEARKAVEEARNISTSSLNVAQNNYAEAQSIIDTLVSEFECMRNHGVAAVANSILNATEMDQAVAALTDVACAVGHHGGYLRCAQHVEEALPQHFGTRHCSVTDQDDETQAEDVYDHLSLPVMELVTDALKHDDYVTRLKSILIAWETVELSDEGQTAGDGGDE